MLLDGNEIDALATGLFLNHNSDKKVILATGGGNVGIGTTNPNVPLHIANGSDVTGTGGGRLLLGSATGAGLRMDGNEIQAFTSGTSKNATLFLQNEGDGNVDLGGGKLYVKSDGKVGLGTSSPGARLHIKQSSNSPTGGIRLVQASGSDYWETYLEASAHHYRFAYKGAAKAQIQIDGAFSQVSDRKLKKNIRQLPGKVDRLPGQPPHRAVREQLTHTVPQA